MTWRFDIVATKDRRLLSRIMQTFENHLVNTQFFLSQESEDAVQVTSIVSSPDGHMAYRLSALLYRLHPVCSVRVAEVEDASATELVAANSTPPYGCSVKYGR